MSLFGWAIARSPSLISCETFVSESATTPLMNRLIDDLQRSYRKIEASPEGFPPTLRALRKSFRGKFSRVYDINDGALRMQGMMTEKGNVLEITVVRIGLWDAGRRDFLRDGEVSKKTGLKSGVLFLKFAESLMLWALESKSKNPALEVLRIDAMSLRNPVLLPLLKSLGFKAWPLDERNYRLELPFSQLTDGLPGFSAEPSPGIGM